MSHAGCLPELQPEPGDSAATAHGAGWLRYDLAADPAPRDLYGLLAGTARRQVGTAESFFVHTPAGIRLRCRTTRRADTDAAWQAALSAAGSRGWLTAWRPATHEPEQFGLGGPRAMAAAHRVFAADSAAWLGFHSDAEVPAPTIPRWAMSLLMIRALLTGLHVTGWQFTDVWDRVARTGGRRPTAETVRAMPRRRLAAAPTGTRRAGFELDPALRRLAIAIRAGWDDPGVLRDRLAPEHRRLVAEYETAVRTATADWAAAPVTPAGLRHGVALAVIFHWNRAGLPMHHQRLLTAALAEALPSGPARSVA